MISAVIFFALGFIAAMAVYERERLRSWSRAAYAWIHNRWQNFNRKG